MIKDLIIKCDKFIEETMELNDLPALAIGVSCNGSEWKRIVANKRIEAEGKSQMNEESIFHCASVSKTFTATAIMKLVEAGALNLYDRLCNLVPEIFETSCDARACIDDWRFKEIRLWNLLSHTSGLGDVMDYHWDRPETDEEALRRYVLESSEVIDKPMLWSPQSAPEFYGPVTDENGEEAKLFRYSNIAYEILGYIVAKYSARMKGEDAVALSYEDFIAKYIFEEIDMKASSMKTFERCDFNSQEERNKCNMAAPYMKDEGRAIVPVSFYPYTRYHAPSSTLTSTLGDLLKWGRAHMQQPRILQEETYDSVWRDYATVPNNGEKMGLGWFMRKQKVAGIEYSLFGHEGTDDGFRASFWICPELDLVMVVLVNLSNAPVKKINKKLLELLAK